MKFATTKERIIQFIEKEGIGTKEFLEKTGIKRGFLDTDKLKATVNDVFIAKIIAKYENINLEWLLTGQGTMLKNTEVGIITENVPSVRKTKDRVYDFQRVPLFNLEATMGLVPLLENNDSAEEAIIDYLSIPNLSACDGAIYATGDSMYPLLKSGDIVAYKKIEPQNIFFGEIYIVSIYLDSTSTYKTIKFIQKSELGDDYIKMVSQNQHHPPKDVKIDQIAAIGLIRASIRIHN
ncbi:helix-turn-helix transcriptional regulator [Flavobacterium sp. '19STA2R22 D10 B1']|uniref:S24 family peptidase n=1 Tax=Flavobacterium aerium TaxID=3037261 RepID=UPI00278C8140|nr:S24 family peptidase [Flavobacterium sp. '19STA2R22 D10 B1']